MQTLSVPVVASRSEWNSNAFIIPKWERKEQKKVSTHLETQFPVHRIVDRVALHSLGFSSLSNLDFFKHLYRLYLSNAFILEKKDPQIIQVMQLPLEVPYRRKAMQEVVTRVQDELQTYHQILSKYKSVSMSKTQQIKEYRKSITHQIKLQQPKDRNLLQLQDVFVERVLNMIKEGGIQKLNYFDYVSFKGIVQQRIRGAGDAQQFLRVLKMKKHLEKIKEQEETLKASLQPIPQDKSLQVIRKLSKWTQERTFFSDDLLQLASNLGLEEKLKDAQQQYQNDQTLENYTQLATVANEIQVKSQKTIQKAIHLFDSQDIEEVSDIMGIQRRFIDLDEESIAEFEIQTVSEIDVKEEYMRARNKSEFYQAAYKIEKDEDSEPQIDILRDIIRKPMHEAQQILKLIQLQEIQQDQPIVPFKREVRSKITIVDSNQQQNNLSNEKSQEMYTQKSIDKSKLQQEVEIQNSNSLYMKKSLSNQSKHSQSNDKKQYRPQGAHRQERQQHEIPKSRQNLDLPSKQQTIIQNNQESESSVSSQRKVQFYYRKEETEVQKYVFEDGELAKNSNRASGHDSNQTTMLMTTGRSHIQSNYTSAAKISLHVEEVPPQRTLPSPRGDTSKEPSKGELSRGEPSPIRDNHRSPSLIPRSFEKERSKKMDTIKIGADRVSESRIKIPEQKGKWSTMIDLPRPPIEEEEQIQVIKKQKSGKKLFQGAVAKVKLIAQMAKPTPQDEQRKYLSELKLALEEMTKCKRPLKEIKEHINKIVRELEGTPLNDEIKYHLQLYTQRTSELQIVNMQANEIPIRRVQPLLEELNLKQRPGDKGLKFMANFAKLPLVPLEDHRTMNEIMTAGSFTERLPSPKLEHFDSIILKLKKDSCGEEEDLVVQKSINHTRVQTPTRQERLCSLLPLKKHKHTLSNHNPQTLRERIMSVKIQYEPPADIKYPYIQKYKKYLLPHMEQIKDFI